MTTLIGQSLGRYHILEQLGEGGMATVYKAYDTRLERDVAVKIIRVDQFAPSVLERILKRFEREAKALGRLTHPNIVKIHDYGEYEGTPYLVMEYLPGGTLKQKLGVPMPWREAFRLLLPVAEALDYAHSLGIIHRDVKPSNILLTQRGQPMLTDFGIAKLLEGEDAQTLTGTGIGVGTPEYMAPEQWLGSAEARSDLYSLGVVLYELLTGRKPYSADTPAAILIKQINDPLPRPGQFIHDLPEPVEKVLLKSLAKNPGDRYTGMSEMTAALNGLLAEPGGQTETHIRQEPVAAIPVVEENIKEENLGTIDQVVDSGTSSTIDQGMAEEKTSPQARQELNAAPPPFVEGKTQDKNLETIDQFVDPGTSSTIDQGVTGERPSPPVRQETGQRTSPALIPVVPPHPRKNKRVWVWVVLLGGFGFTALFTVAALIWGDSIVASLFPSDTSISIVVPTQIVESTPGIVSTPGTVPATRTQRPIIPSVTPTAYGILVDQVEKDISSRIMWVSSGITVSPRNTVVIEYLSGTWNVDAKYFNDVDGAGYPGDTPITYCSWCTAPIPDGTLGQLVAKIVGGVHVYPIGNFGTFQPDIEGILCLMINDLYESFDDDTGSLFVRISVYE